jgi:hypothetical protein
MPMATGPPPVASSRELEVLAAPALPQPLREGGTLSGMPPPPPVPSSRELVVLPAEPAAPAAVPPGPVPVPPKQKVKSRNKSTQKTRPEPRPADAVVCAPARDIGTGPIRGRRRLIWLILLMLALGGGAMAVAYYWPDLVDRQGGEISR